MNEKINFNNEFETPLKSSYLELTPEYIQKNFNSNPKRHWEPPKPVLLENFQNNIGVQLKDISNLARLLLYLIIFYYIKLLILF
jgi:hypothetical protein